MGQGMAPQDEVKPAPPKPGSPPANPALPELGFDHVRYSLRVAPASPGWIAVPPSDLEAAGTFGLGVLVSPEDTIDIMAWEDADLDLESLAAEMESEIEFSVGVDLTIIDSQAVDDWCLEAIDTLLVSADAEDGNDLVIAHRAARRGAFFYAFSMVGYSGPEKTAETFRDALRNVDILAVNPVGSSELPVPRDAVGDHWTRLSGVFEDHLTGLRAVAAPGWRVMGDVELRQRFYDSSLGLTNGDGSFWASYTVMPLPPLMDPNDPQSARDWGDLLGNGFLPAETEPIEFTAFGAPQTAYRYELRQEDYHIQLTRAGLERSGIGIVLDFGFTEEFTEAELARHIQEAVGGFTALDAARCDEVAKLIRAKGCGWVDDGRTLRGGTYRDFKRSMTWTPPTSSWRIAGPGKASRFGRSIRAFASELVTGDQFIVHAIRSRSKDHERAWERFVTRELGELSDERFPAPTAAVIGSRAGWMAKVPALEGDALATLAMVMHGGVRYECILWGNNRPQGVSSAEAVLAGLVIPGEAPPRSDFIEQAYTDRLLGFRMRSPSPEWSHQPIKMSRRDAAGKGACAFLGPDGGRVMVSAFYLDPEDDVVPPEIARARHLAGLMTAVGGPAGEGARISSSPPFAGHRTITVGGVLGGSEYRHAIFVRGHVLYQISSMSEKGTPFPLTEFGGLLEFLP